MRTIKRPQSISIAEAESEITSATFPPEPAYSIPEAAEILGVSAYTVRRLGTTGGLKIIKVSPRRRIVRPSDLRAFMASREDTSQL